MFLCYYCSLQFADGMLVLASYSFCIATIFSQYYLYIICEISVLDVLNIQSRYIAKVHKMCSRFSFYTMFINKSTPSPFPTLPMNILILLSILNNISYSQHNTIETQYPSSYSHSISTTSSLSYNINSHKKIPAATYLCL